MLLGNGCPELRPSLGFSDLKLPSAPGGSWGSALLTAIQLPRGRGQGPAGTQEFLLNWLIPKGPYKWTPRFGTVHVGTEAPAPGRVGRCDRGHQPSPWWHRCKGAFSPVSGWPLGRPGAVSICHQWCVLFSFRNSRMPFSGLPGFLETAQDGHHPVHSQTPAGPPGDHSLCGEHCPCPACPHRRLFRPPPRPGVQLHPGLSIPEM